MDSDWEGTAMSEHYQHPDIAYDPARKIPSDGGADHPWAGDDEGHNCADCIAKGDHGHKCDPAYHWMPRWIEDPTRARLFPDLPTDGCEVCGSKGHTADDHRAGRHLTPIDPVSAAIMEGECGRCAAEGDQP